MRVLRSTTGDAGADVLHRTGFTAEVDHPHADTAISVIEGYLDVVVDSIVNQPRSLQKRIGPSEIGMDCSVSILHKLNGDPDPDRSKIPWKPTVGTGVHAYLEDAFETWGRSGRDPARFLTERKVTVGTLSGEPLTGSCDLFDLWEQVVIDHKIVGPKMLAKYRKGGPSRQYRVQAHTYGKGWQDYGLTPRLVMIAFLPRDGDLEDAYFWSEPYDRSIAEQALARVQALDTLRLTVGIDKALEAFAHEECGEDFCSWHKRGWNNAGANPRPAISADTGVAGILGL